MRTQQPGQRYAGNDTYQAVRNTVVIHPDCLEWMRRVPDECFHAIVTDPPYRLKEKGNDQEFT